MRIIWIDWGSTAKLTSISFQIVLHIGTQSHGTWKITLFIIGASSFYLRSSFQPTNLKTKMRIHHCRVFDLNYKQTDAPFVLWYANGCGEGKGFIYCDAVLRLRGGCNTRERCILAKFGWDAKYLLILILLSKWSL